MEAIKTSTPGEYYIKLENGKTTSDIYHGKNKHLALIAYLKEIVDSQDSKIQKLESSTVNKAAVEVITKAIKSNADWIKIGLATFKGMVCVGTRFVKMADLQFVAEQHGLSASCTHTVGGDRFFVLAANASDQGKLKQRLNESSGIPVVD